MSPRKRKAGKWGKGWREKQTSPLYISVCYTEIVMSSPNVDYTGNAETESSFQSWLARRIVIILWRWTSHCSSLKSHVQSCRCFFLSSMLSHAVMFSLFPMCRSFCIFPTEFPQRTFDTFMKLQKHLDESAFKKKKQINIPKPDWVK